MSNNYHLSPIFLVIMVLGLSCDKKSGPETQKVYRFSETIIVDGLERTYLLNLPPVYYESQNQYSLVIALHGGGGTAEQFESSTGLSDKANASGFIVVYPNGVKSTGLLKAQTWNGGTVAITPLKKTSTM
jgi:polyhydroxybutyrate depolymerase